jgi:hypothetical protein
MTHLLPPVLRYALAFPSGHLQPATQHHVFQKHLIFKIAQQSYCIMSRTSKKVTCEIVGESISRRHWILSTITSGDIFPVEFLTFILSDHFNWNRVPPVAMRVLATAISSSTSLLTSFQKIFDIRRFALGQDILLFYLFGGGLCARRVLSIIH